MTWNRIVENSKGQQDIYEIFYNKSGDMELILSQPLFYRLDEADKKAKDIEWVLKHTKQPILKLIELGWLFENSKRRLGA